MIEHLRQSKLYILAAKRSKPINVSGDYCCELIQLHKQ